MKITRFEDLECWQEARKLTKMVYDITIGSTLKKDLRLSGQIQSAAVSVISLYWDVLSCRSSESSICCIRPRIYKPEKI